MPDESKKYTCPMHPEVVSDKHGKCPKCGMNLVSKGGMNITLSSPWVIAAIIALVGGVLIFGRGSNSLPLVLILLLCPAMMLMMRDKHGH